MYLDEDTSFKYAMRCIYLDDNGVEREGGMFDVQTLDDNLRELCKKFNAVNDGKRYFFRSRVTGEIVE